MAYVLLSQSFGAAKANLPVTITETSTGIPAIILSSATGGLVNSNGDTVLDASGNLSCFVDGAKTWTVNVDSGATTGPAGLLTSGQVAAGAVAVAGLKADGSLVNSAGTVVGLTPTQVTQTQALVSGGGWAQNTMVCLGDSWTNRLGQQVAPNAFAQSTSFHAWANGLKGGALQFINAGVTGDTTAQMLARYSTAVTPFTGKYLHLLGGVNDVANDVAEATTIANLSAMVSLARAEGRIVILGTVAPSGTTTTQARRQALNRINTWIRAQSSESIRVVDYYSGVVDQAGAQRSGCFVGDALHLSAKGASICGLMLHEATPDIPPRAQILSNSAFEAENGLPCGEMNGNNASGSNNFTANTGFTGTGPRGWAWSRTGVAIVATVSKQARTSSKFAADYARAAITTSGADFDVARLERLISYRTWSSGGTANSVRRFVNLTTGAQYDVVTDGNFAAGSDPTASWPTTPGAVFTDGTATLLCIHPLTIGGTYQILAECNISGVSVGTVQPIINCSLMNSSAVVQCTTYGMYHDSGNGTMAASSESGAGLVIVSPALVVPAGFDLASTTSAAGPQIRARLELVVQSAALATVDWGRATIRHG